MLHSTTLIDSYHWMGCNIVGQPSIGRSPHCICPISLYITIDMYISIEYQLSLT